MKIEKIISLANKNSQLRFLAMVRSLRSVGSNLPVWVIPYDDNLFDLPENCFWWEEKDVISLLNGYNAHKMMRKYQCLLTTNYQYVDSDVIFLKDPEAALQDMTGFVTSCGQWHNPGQTNIEETLKYYKEKSTTWQMAAFNAGQYACDVQLFDFKTLKSTIENPLYKNVCLSSKTYDQVALNLLIHLSGVKVNNITLPPYNMQSTWAGDYVDNNYRRYWKDENVKPYIIHWAGCKMDTGRPIDKMFTNYLNLDEKAQWDQFLLESKRISFYKRLRTNFSLIKQAMKALTK